MCASVCVYLSVCIACSHCVRVRNDGESRYGWLVESVRMKCECVSVRG